MKMSNRIRILRAEANMNQEELAFLVGVRRETIVHLENNKYLPSLRLAYDVAKAFQKSIEEVFSFEE